MIELRSDTFTLPTAQMRAAMASAEVGNDDYGEDPTVARLEALAAELVGTEAACLVPSGTMANLVALMAHCARGTKAIVGRESDIYLYEAAGASVCGGIGYEPVVNQPDGTMSLADLTAALPEDVEDPQFAHAAVICLENAHNRCGGVVLPADHQAEVVAFAADHLLAVHLDGARVFNAAVAAGRPVADLVAGADSVQFCLSKGLGAPIGSIVAGDAAFVRRAWRLRKMLGGSMRQAGIVAAAAILGLEQYVETLSADHTRAQALATGIAALPDVRVDPWPQTNMVLFRVDPHRMAAPDVLAGLAAAGVRMLEFGHGRIRGALHSGVSDADVDGTVDALRTVLA